MTPEELRLMFLEGCAEHVLTEYIAVVKGEGEFSGTNAQARIDMWELTQKLIVQASDARKLEAHTTAEVIGLLKTGKVTVKEAKELMEMLRTANEVDILPDLMNKMNDIKKRK